MKDVSNHYRCDPRPALSRGLARPIQNKIPSAGVGLQVSGHSHGQNAPKTRVSFFLNKSSPANANESGDQEGALPLSPRRPLRTTQFVRQSYVLNSMRLGQAKA